jgi:hypothetical protein
MRGPNGQPIQNSGQGPTVGQVTPAELAILAPLTAGSALGPATIRNFEMYGGALTVNVTLNGASYTFRIAHTTSLTQQMHLRATGPYTVYLVGTASGPNQAAINQAWHALESALARNSSVPVPPGLSPCCPFNGSIP